MPSETPPPDKVQLAVPLPTTVNAGDWIRAEGDSATYSSANGNDGGTKELIEPGLGDDADGDMCWYMIDAISANRLELTLASPYLGYIPPLLAKANEPAPSATWQPASVSSSVVKSFDTVVGSY